MHYGFIIPSGDPHAVAAMAHEIEEAGWDGAFYWDGINVGEFIAYDPWVVMAAMALRTERVRLGAIVTPPARRRPWKLARETMTLDHLSGGRLVLPVGLGAIEDGGFAKVGEPTDRKVRAALLDESLEILTGIWSGKPFSYAGEHYQMEEMTFQPPSLQQPRIPIWVVAAWPRAKSMARALRYDGVMPNVINPDGSFGGVTPEIVAEIAAYAREHRQATSPFEIIVEGVSALGDPVRAAAEVAPMAEAGATWWIESMWTSPNEPEDLRRRIAQGPPVV